MILLKNYQTYCFIFPILILKVVYKFYLTMEYQGTNGKHHYYPKFPVYEIATSSDWIKEGFL